MGKRTKVKILIDIELHSRVAAMRNLPKDQIYIRNEYRENGTYQT